MAGSQTEALVDRTAVLMEEDEVRLSLPEATMMIVACSGVLWALLYGAFNALVG